MEPVWNETLTFDVNDLKTNNPEKLSFMSQLSYGIVMTYVECNINAVPNDDIIGYARIPLHHFVRSPVKTPHQRIWFACFYGHSMLRKKLGEEEDEETPEIEHSQSYKWPIMERFC